MSGGHAFNVLAHEETALKLHEGISALTFDQFLFLDRQGRVMDVVVEVKDIAAVELIDTSTVILNNIYNAQKKAKKKDENVTIGQTARRNR